MTTSVKAAEEVIKRPAAENWPTVEPCGEAAVVVTLPGGAPERYELVARIGIREVG